MSIHSYLSHESLLALGILPLDFPTIGSTNRHHENVYNISIAAVRALNAGCSDIADHNGGCDCPEWEDTPQRPKALPFPCMPGNNVMLREWLRNRYVSSTFNTCLHQPLPTMAGPPVEIHLDGGAPGLSDRCSNSCALARQSVTGPASRRSSWGD